MATKFDDPELQLARSRVRSFEEKSENLRRTGGSLGVDQNGEPSLIDERGDRTPIRSERDLAQAARMSMGSPKVNGTPGLGVKGANDSHITGRVHGKEKAVRVEDWNAVSLEGTKPKQEAMLRPMKLVIPVVRPMRPANEDGATSFHFSHEAISKTQFARETARGTKNRKGAAKDHSSYIERDGAVASADRDDLDKIEKELDEIARNDPEMAARLGIEPSQGRNQDHIDAAEVAQALGAGGRASVYIEREEALAHNDNGTAVLFSNISGDPKERRDFWKEVEKHEANPSQDAMRILMRGNEEFWAKVAAEDDCPKVLKTALEAGDPNLELHVRTEDNEAVRKVMARHGWKARERRPEDETDEQKEAREEREVLTSYGARFEDGRGGRVQFRIVGELPHDIPQPARVRILRQFANEFEKRKLPYIAVMHSPDHTNDDRNWHFHLVYHDRPASRFTGRAEDHMWDLQADAGSKKTRQHEILMSTVGSPELEKHAGKWDFMVPWQYVKPDRHTKTTYPFAQEKSREVTRRPFIPMLRRVLAEATNRELERAELPRRLDPRRYSEMGIHKKPDVHLGTQAARLESVGVPTDAGLQNEENQWDHIRQNIENVRIRAERDTESKIRSWNNSLNASEASDDEKDKAARLMVRWEQNHRRAAEHHAIALNLQEHYDRLKSRAEKIKRMSSRHIEAIEQGRATRRQTSNRKRYEGKLNEADAHLKALERLLVDEIGQILSSQKSSQRHGELAKIEEQEIEKMVGDARSRRQARETAAPSDQAAKTPKGMDASGNQVATLTKGQVDGFVKRIQDSGVRLVERDGLVVPREPSRKDLEIIASNGFERTQDRLAKSKAKQDVLIAGLVAALEKNPRMVLARTAEISNDESLPMNERYRIGTRERPLQQAWRMFADEPDVVPAILKALGPARKRQGQDRTGARDAGSTATPARTTEVTGARDQTAAAERTATQPKTPKVPAEQSHVVDTIRERHLRPAAVRVPTGLEITFSREDVALHRMPQVVVIEDDRTISRVEGILAKNDRAVRRLTAYVDKNPGKTREPDQSDPSPLQRGAPAELRTLAVDHARDPQFRRSLENAAIRRRLDALDPRRQEEKQAMDAATEGARAGARQSAVDKPGASEQPSLFERGPNGRLVRRRADVDDREYGVRSIAGNDEAAKAPTDRAEKSGEQEGKRRGAIISDDLLGEGRGRTYERKPTRSLEEGIHPKLDAWIEAEKAKDKRAREKAAAAIRGDRHLLTIVDEMDPRVRARLQRDWDGVEERQQREAAQQAQRGRDNEIPRKK